MRELYTKKMGGRFCNRALALLMFLCCYCGMAFADQYLTAEEYIDLGAMELNKEYVLKPNKAYYGSFTAPCDGYLRVDSDPGHGFTAYMKWLGSFDDTRAEASNNGCSIAQIKTNNKNQYSYEFQIVKGETYWLLGLNDAGLSDTGKDITCKLSMEERKLEYLGPTYADGTVISPSVRSQVSFGFSRKVKFASAELTANGHTVSLSGNTNYDINLLIKDVLIDMATSKQWIKKGDEFTVTIKGVRTESGDLTYDQDIVGKYVLGDVPVSLIKETHTEGTILTWYEPNDPEGLIILEYSGPLGTANAQINFGKTDRGTSDEQFVQIPITPIIDGNKLILDLTGVRRMPADMIKADGVDFTQDDFKKITIGIRGIRDANGVSAYPASKWMTFDLVTPEADIASMFTPNDGSNIDNVDNIVIWIADEAKLKYSGVDFTYVENNETKTVTVIDIQKTDNDIMEGSKDVTVAIPAEVRGKGEVVVTLHELSCVDGKDYSKDISATYTTTAATGIQVVNAVPAQHKDVMYNLQGMKMDAAGKAPKGIYIVNGKKVVK